MSYKILYVLNALLAVLFGLALVFVPGMVLRQFGAEARVPELLLARFFGSATVTVGLVLFFAKDTADERVQKNIGLGLLIGAVLSLIVTVIGISPASGVIRSNGWVAILVSTVLVLVYGYLVFLKPQVQK